jgi:hypothetical protein
MYLEYIYQMGELSRIILELSQNGQFIINDITYILDNINLNKLTPKEVPLIKQTGKNIKILIDSRTTINIQNKEINNFRKIIQEEYIKYTNAVNKIKLNTSSKNNTIDLIALELPLITLIGKAKYNKNLGLFNPDYILKPLRTFGTEMGKLNLKYEKLLNSYNKQTVDIKIWNSILNYITYLISIGLLLFEVKRQDKYNKSFEEEQLTHRYYVSFKY